MPRSQESREMSVETAAGSDALLLRSMEGHEELGRPFVYHLELLSEDPEVAFTKVVGDGITVRLETPGDDPRFFNGVVASFTQVDRATGHADQDDEVYFYEATVVPWIWLLSRSHDCQIFQEMSVPDIIKQVFDDHGVGAHRDALSGSYNPREFCVQYRESAFDFVSRLMEEEGIYYFFEHENGKHTLVLMDDMAAHEPITGYENLSCRKPDEGKGEYCWDLSVTQRVKSGASAHESFDFKAPKKNLGTNANISREHEQSKLEVFDFPGVSYTEVGDGDHLSQTRVEEFQARQNTLWAKANARGLTPGHKITLDDLLRQDLATEYLLTAVDVRIVNSAFRTRGAEAHEEEPPYACTFECLSTQEVFRAASITKKPQVVGPQTAIVTGKSGEEIWTDEHGRVKVLFHWDRYGKADETSSCWIRVAQPSAGKNWGWISLPRIGQEVIVEFLEGDPDRPIITGRVYNGDAAPPYKLPDNKTISTFKSNSSKGGGGFNEFRFEDKKGDEQVFLHAEKNQDTRVKNDTFEWIGHDRHLNVKNDQVEHVENDRHETVDRDHNWKIGRDQHLAIDGKQAIKVAGLHSLIVEGDVVEEFKKNHSETVTDDYYLKATNIVIEGTQNITLKVGQSHIAIESGGIKLGTTGDIVLDAKGTIKGKAMVDVKLEATANVSIKGAMVKIKGQAMAEMASPMTTVKGDGMLTLKGGMVMIN